MRAFRSVVVQLQWRSERSELFSIKNLYLFMEMEAEARETLGHLWSWVMGCLLLLLLLYFFFVFFLLKKRRVVWPMGAHSIHGGVSGTDEQITSRRALFTSDVGPYQCSGHVSGPKAIKQL